MKPLDITCSDALKEAMAEAIRRTPGYEAILQRFDGDETSAENFRRYTGYKYEGEPPRLPYDWSKTCAESMHRLLHEQRATLSFELQQEIAQLEERIYGLISGMGCPAILFKNLPPGMTGIFAQEALVNMSCAQQTGVGNWVHMDAQESAPHSRQHLHRDQGHAASIHGFMGFDVGEKPMTTAVVDSEEFIEAIARAYRQRAQGIAFDEALTPRQLEQARAVLQLPCYAEHNFKNEDGSEIPLHGNTPLVIEDPEAREGREWPKRWRLHPAFSLEGGVGLDHEWLQNYPELVHMKAAIKDASDALKEKSDLVIGPGEMLMMNESFTLHAAGHFTEDKRAQKGHLRTSLSIRTFMGRDDENPGRTGHIVLQSETPQFARAEETRRAAREDTREVPVMPVFS